MTAGHNDLISEIVNRLAASGYRLTGKDEVLDKLIQQAVESDDALVNQFAVRLGMYMGEAVFRSLCSGKDPSDTPLEVSPELLQSFQLETNEASTELAEQIGTTEAEMQTMLREAYRLRGEARSRAGQTPPIE